MRSKQPKQQKGVALMIVLMVVAFVAVIGVDMAGRLQLQVQRAANIKDNNQAYWYAMGAEQFAKTAILRLIDADPDVVNMEQEWSQEFTYPLEGGGIQAQLSDMQNCFNLNALRESGDSRNPSPNPSLNADDSGTNGKEKVKDPGTGGTPADALTLFQTMIKNGGFEIDSYSAEVFSDSLADWLDEDSNLRQNGAEDSDYESLVHPYLAANNLMANKSELRLINGVDLEWLSELLPLVCVIPGDENLKINVNTIQAEQAPVLAAITGLPLEDAKSEIASRDPKGWDKVEDFLAEPALQALGASEGRAAWLDVKTQHFILRIKTRYNNATFKMSSVLKVDNGEVTVIRREFGGVT